MEARRAGRRGAGEGRGEPLWGAVSAPPCCGRSGAAWGERGAGGAGAAADAAARPRASRRRRSASRAGRGRGLRRSAVSSARWERRAAPAAPGRGWGEAPWRRGGRTSTPPRGAGAWRSCGRGAAPRGFPRKVGRWARPAAPPVLGGGPPTGRASHRALRAEGKVSGAAAAACGEPRRDGPVPRSVMRCTRPFRNESERARSHGLIFPEKSVEPWQCQHSWCVWGKRDRSLRRVGVRAGNPVASENWGAVITQHSAGCPFFREQTPCEVPKVHRVPKKCSAEWGVLLQPVFCSRPLLPYQNVVFWLRRASGVLRVRYAF